ncbi:MAG TPA: LptA/OstA family protein [Alphaproteobacteria bacterium]|nr:LptA/OstA family protein [Alphaproteobacteria bacterium]
MNRTLPLITLGLLAGLSCASQAQDMPGDAGTDKGGAKPVEVTADQSLEWYQDQHIYVARGNAKAVRGDMTVDADTLTAHEREKPVGADGKPVKTAKPAKDANDKSNGAGDIDKMTAEGHVRITNPRQRVTGDHAVDDLDQHVMVVTGNNLKYETEKETVTARDSLEYWDEKKIAVARGNAVADRGDRHVEADTLTAEFRDQPNGSQELTKMTAIGHVTVITRGDVSKGDQAVYDVSRDIAVLTGNVRITRADGTQLTGDVGEVDFKTNQSRLMNEGHGRVRALLTSKTTSKANKSTPTAAP